MKRIPLSVQTTAPPPTQRTGPPIDSGWALRRLADAPHRLFFFLGAANLVLASLWWCLLLVSRSAGMSSQLPGAGAAAAMHPLVMMFGFFPFFIFGFGLTAGTRWLNVTNPPLRAYLLPALGMGAAMAAFMLATFVGPIASAITLLLYAACFAWLWKLLLSMVLASRADDKVHAWLLVGSLGAALFTLAASIVAISLDLDWRPLVRAAGIWAFLVPLFCTVCHRMLPFFTASALPDTAMWRPWWLLFVMVAGALLHGIADFAGAQRWVWLVDLPLAGACFAMVWRWGLMQSLRNRLLAMLHLSFVWLSIAYTLSAIQSLLLLAGLAVLGSAPLHAVTIGFLASISLAMVTRVTCGHSGRTLAADNLTWAVFLVFQSTTVARVAAEVFPPYYSALVTLAAVIWLGCFALWCARNAPIYLRARADGKPG